MQNDELTIMFGSKCDQAEYLIEYADNFYIAESFESLFLSQVRNFFLACSSDILHLFLLQT